MSIYICIYMYIHHVVLVMSRRLPFAIIGVVVLFLLVLFPIQVGVIVIQFFVAAVAVAIITSGQHLLKI